jgi:hypothetical protein
MGTSPVNLSSTDVELAPPQSSGDQTPSLSSSDVEVEGQQHGPVNPYANDMSNVAGAVPGMQTPLQAAGNRPYQPVEKASVMDVLSGMPAPPSSAQVARDQRAVNAVRQFVHGPESAEEQNAQLQVAQHPSDQQALEAADPILASVPVGAYKTGEGLGTTASGIRAGDWSKAARGGTETLSGLAEAATIPMGVAIAKSPIRMAIGYAEGLATGAGAKAVAQKLNLTPDEVEFANAIGFFAPMAYHTAIGLELSTEQQGATSRVRASAFGGRVQGVAATSPDAVGVAGQVGPFKFGWAKPRSNPNVDFSSQGPTTGLPGEPEAPSSSAPQTPSGPPPSPSAGGAPKFYLQSSDPAGTVTPKLVAQIAGLVQNAPAEMREQLTIQAHEQTIQQAIAKGSILGMSGKPIPITSPAQAQQVVGQMFASAGLPRPAPPAPPDAVALQQKAQSQTITEIAASAASIDHQAAQIAGLAPPPPPPPKPGDPGSMQMPKPAGMDDGLLTQDTVDKAGAAIQALPPKLRPTAILEATGNLAKWLFGQKTAIGPDGKVVNVDSQKAAQTVAVKIINDEVDRQTEQAKAQQDAQQTAIQERQESAKQAQEERDQAIAPEGEKTASKSTTSTEPVEIPDTPAVRKASMVLGAAPMDSTSEQLDALIRRTATVTAGVRKRMVEQEIQRRANRQEDHAQAGMMGTPAAPGQSREELQRWADAVGKGEHPFLHVPAGSEFKPAGVEHLTRTQVKGAGPFSGTYYHSKEIESADIRKAARSKTGAQAALDALGKGGAPAAEQKPVELKAEDVETEQPKPETKAAEGETKASNQVAKQEVSGESKEVKRGEVGMMLAAGEVVLTATGRKTTPFPKIDNDSNRKAGNTVKRVDQWLMDNAIAEARARGDEFNLRQFEANRDKPSQSDKDSAEMYLFDKESVQPIPKSILKPITLPPEAATGLTALVDDHASTDPTATLDDVLRHKDTGNFIAQALVNDGIITNSAENVNAKTGLLTTSAKAKVGDALLGELLPPEVIEQTPDFLKQKLLGTMGAIKGILSAGDGWNLQEQIVAATERYDQIFRGQDTYEQGPVVEAILKKLDDPIDKVRSAFSSFAVAATNHDPSDKPFFDFNLAFGTELTEEQFKAGLKPVEKPAAAEPEVKDFGEFLKEQEAERKALKKGDKVTYRTNKGKERTGEVAWTDGKKVRITDGGSTVNKNIEDVKPIASPAETPKTSSSPGTGLEKVDLLYPQIYSEEIEGLRILAPDPKDVKSAVDQLDDDAFRLPGVRQVPVSAFPQTIFDYPGNKARDRQLWEEFQESGEITPIVATVDLTDPSRIESIEGIHRLGAFARNGKKTIPVVLFSGLPPEKQVEAKPEPAADATLVDALQLKFEHGAGPKNYNDLKKIVTEFDGSEPDQIRMKEAQEAYEAMLNRIASEMILKGRYGRGSGVYEALVGLYEGQPNLSIRTSTSIANQAYSTPLPLAFIADSFAGITWNTTTVYEPTAGNGALLIAANPKMTQANELNPARAATLQDEGFTVTQHDATIWSPVERVDAVVANPPFGPLAGPVKVDGYNVVKLDHLIVAKALGAMKDAGKAAIIIAAGDREKPGEITNQVRPFFNWLYAHYNVVSDFELDGDLYSRQGASFPVRLIAIDGRVRSAKVSPDAAAIQRLKTWGEVYDKAAEHLGTNLAGKRPANDVAGGPVRDESADTGAVSRTATGPNRPTDSGQPDTSEAGTGSSGNVVRGGVGPISHSGRVPSFAVGSADSTTRPDGDIAFSDRLAEGQPAPRTVRREPAKPDGHSANALADESNQFQATFKPMSEKKDVGIMAPKALVDPMLRAMEVVHEEVGDLDQFVTDQLGYSSVEEMHEAFMGIQTDAIAAAIYQMQRSKALIVADQTGVGKGRVAAAMIRWADLHGHLPIFVTEKANLFSDMYRDLKNIGSGQTITPLLFNADASITDSSTGTKIFRNSGAMRPVLDRIRETGELPKGSNAVFLTYSQINKEDNRQQQTLQRIASNAIFILDESHNAGGDSNTGDFLTELTTASKGVVFLSATWAKRPDNLPLYAGMTDISIAIPDRDLVASAITAGGAPLQAVLTSLLAQTGQFVRRERSFDGIEFKNQTDEAGKAKATRISDQVTEILRAIMKADKMFHNLDFARIVTEAKAAGKSAGSKGLTVSHMEFSSTVHNLVRQLLLALKCDDSIVQIVAAIERGERPIYALENTAGSFLEEYIDGNNLAEDDLLPGLDYSRVTDRTLMRTRYYNETGLEGDKRRVTVPLSDLSPAVREAYDEAQDLIDALKVDLPVSPIDYIRNGVTKAGYKIAEITGREWAIDYSGEIPKLTKVPGIERKDRVNTQMQFNNGGLDALLINRAAAAGISLHASHDFRDVRPRHMIVGQPAADVNVVIQMLGRINRTGQVALPLYTMLASALPAEQRPQMNLAKKMKSLNANVSSNTRAATSVQAVDLMNKYGDKIVAQYLFDNPDMSRMLGLSADTNEQGQAGANEGLAMKATGHSALLPVAQQQEFMDSISEAYTNYIDFLDETGQNDLEPRTYDFAARETHIERMYQGVDPSSPFGQDAHYGEYSIKRQGKPFTPEEVMEKIAETFGPDAMKLPPRERDTLAARALDDHFEAMYKTYLAGLTHQGTVDRAQQMRTRGRQLLNDYRVGVGVHVDINGEGYNGVITNIEGAKKPSGNPYAPSALQFTIAVNSGLRQTKVPGSQMDSLATSNLGRNADVRQLFKGYGGDRQKAKIITGNLLGAYGELKAGSKGRIISFTMDDGTTKLGIQMPSKFDIKEDVSGTYAMRTPEGAKSFLETGDQYLQSSGSEIGITGPSNRREGFEIRTKKSKSASGKFFLDPKLLDMVQGGEFASSGGLMRATVKEGRELDALKAIMGKIALYANPSHVDEARTHDEKAKAELDKPKSPSRFKDLMKGEEGSFAPLASFAAIGRYAKKAAVGTWKEALGAVKSTGKSAKAMGHEVAAAFAPGAVADTDALDIMGKALGEPALRLFEAGQFLQSISQMLDKLSPDDRVEFVDRWQRGVEQPTQDLQHAQEFMQTVLSQQRIREQEAVNLGKRRTQQVELSDKANYFPNRYKVAPGGEKELTEDQQIARLGQVSRRPFEGSKAFMKQQRYTLKEAVADGAEPLGNPVEMLLRRLQEGAKFVAARYAWYNFKDQGLAMFLKGSKKLPKDYAYVDDKSGNVWRMVQSIDGDTFPVQTGRWVIQKDAARLLNNYLSVDHIKGSEVLSAFVKLKNFSTEMKLAISAFHWAYITVENMASVLNTGMDKVVNQGIRGLDPTKVSAGLADIAMAMIAPYTAIKRGGQTIQYARNPDEFLESPEGKKFAERYPDFPHLMELLFSGGLRWNIAQQFQGSFGDHCLDAWKDGEIGKGLLKFLPWLSHGLMTPLFNHYIPRSKWAFAVELLSTKLAQYSYAIASGEKTEEEIAREVAQTTDNRFGELNWDSLYLNNDLKSAAQFFFRSATWALGSWRGAVQGVKEQTSSKMFDDKMFEKMDAQAKKGDWLSQARRATSRLPQLGVNAGWILSMALLTSTLGSVTEKLATGKYPWQWAQQDSEVNGMSVATNAAMEAMHPRTGPVNEHGEPIRMSWPTGLKDYEHGFENPKNYAKGKVSDVAINAWNTMANSDWNGDYVYDPNAPLYKEMWQGLKYNVVGDLTPMSADNWLRTYGPQDTASKVLRFTGMIGGAPKSLDRSHALTQALELNAVRHPHTPLTPDQQVERDYSREHPTQHSIRAAARARNLDYLERVFKFELSYTDAKAVYEDPKTTAAEREQLKPFLNAKRINAIKSARRK